jgi:uncharacterized membrane protein YebE (DUF533 family)
MRNLILVGALALLLLSPLTATAQQRAAPAPAAPAPTIEGLTSTKVLTIGAGALLGVVVAQAIVAGEGLTLVGAAAGGVLAAWWYDNSGGGATRAAMRAQTGAPALARAERLALAR